MGSYVFTWDHSASEVYVTGSFDNWSKSAQLDKKDGTFAKKVELPSADKPIEYKFVVDNDWVNDHTKPTATDSAGNVNNVLQPEEIDTTNTEPSQRQHGSSTAAGAVMSGIGPNSSTAQMAGQVPLEKDRSAASDTPALPGTFPPETQERSRGPSLKSAASDGMRPIELFPGDIVPDYSTYTSATVNAGASNDESLKKSSNDEAQAFGVSPLPATGGHSNPVQVKPGEALPPTDSYTSNTTQSHVKHDMESYEKSDVYPASTDNNTLNTQGGAFGVPPVQAGMIPESSLPMGGDTGSLERDMGPVIQSAGSGTSTAALAGNVPLEPRGVPEVVKESQEEAHQPPEASSSGEAVQEKSNVEQELKVKVPEAKPTSEGSPAPRASGGGLIGGIGLPSSIQNAISSMNFGRGTTTTADPVADQSREVTETVPTVVKDAQDEANASPEASANPEAVTEKSAVEKELMSKVAKTDEAGEPAPAVSAATYKMAPQSQETSQMSKDVAGAETGQDASGVTGAEAGQDSDHVTGAATTFGGAGAAAAVAARATSSEAATTEPRGAPASTTTGAEPMSSMTGEEPLSSRTGADPLSSTTGAEPMSSTTAAEPMSSTTGAEPLSSATEAEPLNSTTKAQPLSSPTGAEPISSTQAAESSAPAASTGLNAPADKPAQSVATETGQVASEATRSQVASKPKENKKTETLPGSSMLPTRPRDDSRDVSPMSKPTVTSGIDSKTTPSKSTGAASSSSPAGNSSASASKEEKKNRRSFFGKIKDKLK